MSLDAGCTCFAAGQPWYCHSRTCPIRTGEPPASPPPPPSPRLVRWVACAADVAPAAATHRHLLAVASGSQGTTLCSATGLGEGVWRGNSQKPKCPACVQAAASRDVEVQ